MPDKAEQNGCKQSKFLYNFKRVLIVECSIELFNSNMNTNNVININKEKNCYLMKDHKDHTAMKYKKQSQLK